MTSKLVFLQYFFSDVLFTLRYLKLTFSFSYSPFCYDSYSQDSHYTETSKESTGLTIDKVFIL